MCEFTSYQAQPVCLSLDAHLRWCFRAAHLHCTSEGALGGVGLPLTLCERAPYTPITPEDFFRSDGRAVFTAPSFPGITALVFTWGTHEGSTTRTLTDGAKRLRAQEQQGRRGAARAAIARRHAREAADNVGSDGLPVYG
jgi:hypothetical protein